jgi:hypothetical protein
MEAMRPPKRRFLREARQVTSQKTAFFKVTAVKNSNLTNQSALGKYLHSSHTDNYLKSASTFSVITGLWNLIVDKAHTRSCYIIVGYNRTVTLPFKP